MTYCNPYLLSLGLSKSKTSLVWIAGPLSGLIVQPIVGTMADESRSKWGRRRPFIAGGSVIVAIALLVLGFTKDIVSFFVSDAEAAKSFTIFLAILSIYVVDFSINAGSSASICPPSGFGDTPLTRHSHVGVTESCSGHFAHV